MIKVSYHICRAGVSFDSSDTHFILRDGPASHHWKALQELMSRGGQVSIDEVWIPETPVTLALFCEIQRLVPGPLSHSEWFDQSDRKSPEEKI